MRADLHTPHVEHGDDGDGEGPWTMISWHYGPQGHPVSMSLTIYQDKDHLQLWENIVCEHTSITHENNFLEVIERFCKLGEAVEARFGHDWRWHQCEPGCTGWRSGWSLLARTQHNTRCVDCEQLRRYAELAAKQFHEEYRARI